MAKLGLPIKITPTRVELGLRCHRKHVLTDLLGRAKYRSPSLEFGSVIHSGVSALWLNRKQSTQPHWSIPLEQEWDKRFVKNPDISTESVSLAMANGMMEYYDLNAKLAGGLGGEEDGWKLVDVEQRFEVPIQIDPISQIIISFQCDRIVAHEDGRLAIVDTKTAARLDSRWDKQWEMSIQMKLYRLLVQTVFDREDVIVIVEGVKKHVPSELRYVMCPEWSTKQLGEALYMAKSVAARDHDLLVKGVGYEPWDPDRKPILTTRSKEELEQLAVAYTLPNYGECFSYNVECPFRQICIADVDERVGILRGEYFEIPEEEETY